MKSCFQECLLHFPCQREGRSEAACKSHQDSGTACNKDPLRDRKLLVNKREINKLVGLIKQKGYSLVPISMYFKGNFVKVELGIGKGKKLYDKRREIAKKDAEMRMRRAKN